MSCPQCVGIEQFFDAKEAERELGDYRRKGPDKTTRMLIDALVSAGVTGKTLLDIGGGVGAVQHELINAGVRSAVDVDGSSAYIEAARGEAERQGHEGRVSYHHGDFVELAPRLEQADIVTMDRVVCCYPDMERLLELSAARAGSLYGQVYPRAWPLTRAAVRLSNLYLKLVRRNPFRVFIHDPEEIDATVRDSGLRPRYHAKTLVWNVVVYQR